MRRRRAKKTLFFVLIGTGITLSALCALSSTLIPVLMPVAGTFFAASITLIKDFLPKKNNRPHNNAESDSSSDSHEEKIHVIVDEHILDDNKHVLHIQYAPFQNQAKLDSEPEKTYKIKPHKTI